MHIVYRIIGSTGLLEGKDSKILCRLQHQHMLLRSSFAQADTAPRRIREAHVTKIVFLYSPASQAVSVCQRVETLTGGF